MQQWNLTLQQEIFPQTSLSIGYVGSRGLHLGRLVDNVAFSVNTPQGRAIPRENWDKRRNPNWGEVRLRSFDANSYYEGLTIALRKRYSRGFQMQVSYTFSKSTDDESFFIGQGETAAASQWALVPEDPSFDRGLSTFDVRNNLVFNATYELPFGPGKSFGSGWTGAAEKLLAGWGFNTIMKVQNGTPTTAELGFNRTRDARAGNGQALRPDLAPGKSINPVLGGPDRYYDPTAFAIPQEGFYGNLARNTVVGPGLVDWDFSLMKNTRLSRISENFNLQFRAEFFNILNRANFGDPQRTVFNSSGRILGSAGRISNTVTSARQVQFGLKVIW